MSLRIPKALPALALAAAVAAFPQTISPGGVVNAASHLSGIAPGSVISILGTNLAPATLGAPSVPLPTVLAGTTVTVNSTPVPLFYVSPSQINAQLPYETAPGAATLIVTVNGTASPVASFTVLASAPGILTYGNNRAVAFNLDNSLNGLDRPALPGSVVTVFMVGQGATGIPVQSGYGSPSNPPAQAAQPVTVTVGGRAAAIQFAQLSPGDVGLFEVNFTVPSAAAGDSALVVVIGGVSSNQAMLAVAGADQSPGPVTIVRTFAYHQLTSLPDKGPDFRTSTAISGDGTLIAYSHDAGPNQVYTMNFDGSGQKLVDSYQAMCYCGTSVDLSRDGSKIALTEGRQLRVINRGAVQTLLTLDSSTQGIAGLRIEGDGLRVFFLIDRDSGILGGPKEIGIQRGLYVMNVDGSQMRQIVGPDAVAALFGSKAANYYTPEFADAGNLQNDPLSVSDDGSRIVFAAAQVGGSSPQAVFGVNLDGSHLHIVHGPVPYLGHIAISGDGSKVLYGSAAGGLVETGVVNFDGTGLVVLRTDGLGSKPGVQLTADGAQALAFDILYNTDGSGALQLSTTFNFMMPSAAVMNAKGTRFVFPFVIPGTYSQGLTQLASAEINPVSLGAAPVISAPAVNPIYVFPDDVSTATAGASIAFSGRMLQASYATALNGLLESPPTANVSLFDDGTNGDLVAHDGTYTTNNVQAPYKSAVGPRTLRLFAQVVDSAGLLHATLVDVAPFFVLSQAPLDPVPSISGVSSAAAPAGSQLVITGSGFDPTPANNQVIVGVRLARVLSASGNQLTVVVPPDLASGSANVFVAAQGQASNAMSFAVK